MRFFLAIFIVLFSFNAHAAKPARVEADAVELLDAPKSTSSVVTTMRKGSALAVSNVPTEGYYKARTSSGDIGWIPVDAIIIYDIDQLGEQYKKGVKSSKSSGKWLRFDFLGGAGFFEFTELNSAAGGNVIKGGAQFGGGISFLLGSVFMIGLRAEHITKSFTGTDSATSDQFLFTATSLPVMGGIGLEFGRDSSFSVELSGYGGMALNNQLLITGSSSGQTLYSSQPLLGLGKLTMNIRLSKTIGFFIEGGYLYYEPKTVSASSTDIASSIIADSDGNFPDIKVDFSGPFAGGGISFSF